MYKVDKNKHTKIKEVIWFGLTK